MSFGNHQFYWNYSIIIAKGVNYGTTANGKGKDETNS